MIGLQPFDKRPYFSWRFLTDPPPPLEITINFTVNPSLYAVMAEQVATAVVGSKSFTTTTNLN